MRGKTNWKDVDRVRLANPDFTATEIADTLGCMSHYVRATAQRRHWTLPKHIGAAVTLRVPTDRVAPLCRPNETPHQCLRRLVHKILVSGARRPPPQ
ncbi:MAG TPA: hypothetical protein VGG45_16310 [Terracidiphilus sp.]|jgi:hypothetical protein